MKEFYLGGVCFITDRNLWPEVMDSVKRVLDGGIRWVQLREKSLTRREVFYLGEKLRKLTWQYNAILIINDYPDIAIATDADGVHLGQDDLPIEEARKVLGNRIIGISTHTIEEALDAQARGADYIGFGPVYGTTTKPDALTPRGLQALKTVSEAVSIPVVAIGGIKLENLKEVLDAGASAVAVASGILSSEDPKRQAEEFVKIIKEAQR
ncbi:MAG: thiamine phosphate synthase [Nitrospirae bacterium]|nr:MAG: thiamine phosphate synthase [Nitrospirota bacterium]